MTFKDLRQHSGMTQKAFSEYFNIPKRTVENWEGGQNKCPEYLLSLMAYKLKKEGFVPVGYNMDGTICAEEAEAVKQYVERFIAEYKKPILTYVGRVNNDIPSATIEPIIDTETFEEVNSALLKKQSSDR